MLLPLLSQGDEIGVIGISTDQPGREFTPDEVMVAETIAGQIAGAIETARLFEQAQQGAVADERNRLARELHDSVTQTLYSLDLFADATRQALSAGKIERATKHIQQILSLSRSALADMRLLIFELRPPLLDQAGLAGALRARVESVEARAGFKTEFEAKGERPMSHSVEAELYAVALEVLNNTLKHAQAKRITVNLEWKEQRCCLTIRDDGIGFDPEIAEDSGGFGLHTMRERIERLGGNLTLETAPDSGTTVRVEVTA
jgi:signal transduction histidine kinase